jgi:hypothetical protein
VNDDDDDLARRCVDAVDLNCPRMVRRADG